MATLDPQTAPVDGGVTLSTSDASADGDEAPIGRGRMLYVKVDSGASSSREITVSTQATVDGLAVDDVTKTLDPGDVWLLSLTSVFRDPDSGRANVTYDDESDVTVAVIEPERT